jgi:hypothetical protein
LIIQTSSDGVLRLVSVAGSIVGNDLAIRGVISGVICWATSGANSGVPTGFIAIDAYGLVRAFGFSIGTAGVAINTPILASGPKNVKIEQTNEETNGGCRLVHFPEKVMH